MLRFLFISLFALCVMDPGFAATRDAVEQPPVSGEIYRLNNSTADVQKLLQKLGRYEGAIDGFMGSDLEQAIRQYQKEHGLPVDGKVSRDLIGHLENVGRVRALIRRLDDVREKRREKARQALMADPRTRRLLEEQNEQTADPTQDLSACFEKPTPRCLLLAAVKTSRAVYEDDMRDWALGEILAAQVSVGMDREAMQTAARIKDSRLIIAALTNIAKTHVQEGKIEEALTSVTLIPVAQRRLSVMLEIARVYRRTDQQEDLAESIKNILAVAGGVEPLEDGLALQIEAAEVLAAIDKDRALHLLEQMSERTRILTDSGLKNTLMRQVAVAVSNIGYPEWSLKFVEQMPDDETRIPVLMAAARSFLEQTRFTAAQRTIERIAAERYRSVILSDMARALWRAGKDHRALETIEEAEIIARSVRLPFARNFALSNIAHTLVYIAGDTRTLAHAERAFNLVQEISDDRLRARGLWELAHAAEQYHFQVSDTDLDAAATTATAAIPSKFSRAWVLGDLAAFYQQKGDRKRARRAFDLGLETVALLKNPWARARALAKFAALVHRID